MMEIYGYRATDCFRTYKLVRLSSGELAWRFLTKNLEQPTGAVPLADMECRPLIYDGKKVFRKFYAEDLEI